jgi:hypothetical protein
MDIKIDEVADALVHSPLTRLHQVVGLVWAIYPGEIEIARALDALEGAGMPRQNRSRLSTALRSSSLVSRGARAASVRLNPKHKPKLDAQYGPIVGPARKITVRDNGAVIPSGTVPLDRRYIERIVAQVNEGYTAGHYDSAAVLLRRLSESLIIECYVRLGRQSEIQMDSSFFMLDSLLAYFQADKQIAKSRNLVRHLRKIKEVGDTAAHSRSYITKQADIDDIKFDARRALSELAVLAGL